MTPDVLARAFEPFFTTKPVDKGTGLGLSQVFGFVKQSGGHVKIYSEPGEGTTVKIYLKRNFGEEQEAPEPQSAVDAARRPTETVLVVEDDERVRIGTVDALRELGYVVVHAGSAAEALKKLAEYPDVALLFTDIVMPAMNGRKLAEEALAGRPGLKVLFTTGFTRNAVVHNGVLDPGVNFIAKPFTLDQLAAKLREVLDRW
jgi:CheY-like chemotaxis protein